MHWLGHFVLLLRPVVSIRISTRPSRRVRNSWLDDPFPDYDTEPVMAYANA